MNERAEKAKLEYEEALKKYNEEKKHAEVEYKNELLREPGLEENLPFSSYYLEFVLKFCNENNADANFLIGKLADAESCVTGNFCIIKRRFYNYILTPKEIEKPQAAEDYYHFAMEVLDAESYGNNANRNFVASLLEKASNLAESDEIDELPQNQRRKISVAYRFILENLDGLYEAHSKFWWDNY